MLPILTFVDPTSIWERQKGGVQSRLHPPVSAVCNQSPLPPSHSRTAPRVSPSAATTRDYSDPQKGIPGPGELFLVEQHHQDLHPVTAGCCWMLLWVTWLPGGAQGMGLTACWKSVDMPMLSSTFSMGRFSFSHTSCRRDSST